MLRFYLFSYIGISMFHCWKIHYLLRWCCLSYLCQQDAHICYISCLPTFYPRTVSWERSLKRLFIIQMVILSLAILLGYTKSEAGYLVALSASLDLFGRLGFGYLSDLQIFDLRKAYVVWWVFNDFLLSP